MTTQQSVLRATLWLIDKHQQDILNSQQLHIGAQVFTGHGDDIWLRTETVHVIAEVTQSGDGLAWNRIKGTKKKGIVAKLTKLRLRKGVTHRYMFVPSSIEPGFVQKENIAGVTVVPII